MAFDSLKAKLMIFDMFLLSLIKASPIKDEKAYW